MSSDDATRAAELAAASAAAAELADPAAAAAALRAVALAPGADGPECVRVREAAVSALCANRAAAGDGAGLAGLLTDLRPLFAVVPKAKTAKLVRGVIDAIAKVPGSEALQLSVCKEVSAWARAERRTFLRQRVDARLAGLLLAPGGGAGSGGGGGAPPPDPGAALALLAPLASEVKRLDDKLMLVDVHLLESRAHAALRNLPRARAALTAARSAANAVYVPPSLQAEIDGQSGALHAEEADYKTAFSYFYEAFEARAALAGGGGGGGGAAAAVASGHAPAAPAADPATGAAVGALAAMLLCKVLAGEPGDVPGLVAAKAGVRFAGPAVDALSAVATAAADRSLEGLADARARWPAQLDGDAFVGSHLSRLADRLLEANLLRLAEPYSRVEVGHLAGLIGLPRAAVLAKLSQMILDGRCAGTLDSEADCLELFEAGGPEAEGAAYAAAADAFTALGGAVDALAVRAQKVA